MDVIHLDVREARHLLIAMKATMAVLEAFEGAGMRPEFDMDPRMPLASISSVIRYLEATLPSEAKV